MLAGRDGAHDQRARGHLGLLAHPGARRQHAAGTDPRPCADPDLTDVEDVPVDPVPAQVDLWLDRGVPADLQHAGDRRQGVQVGALADLGTEQPRVEREPRGASEPGRRELVLDPRRQPHPEVHLTAPGVAAGLHARAGAGGRGRPRASSVPGGAGRRSVVRISTHTGYDGNHGSRSEPSPVTMVHSRASQDSQRAAASARSGTRASSCPTWVRTRDRHHLAVRARRPGAHLLEGGGQRGDRGVRVDVAHHDLGDTAPAGGSPPGRRSASRHRSRRSRRWGRRPRRRARRSRSPAIQAWVGDRSRAAAGAAPLPGGGQGSASRSTLPEVRVGRLSTTASRGTSAAGIRSRRSSSAVAGS